MREKKLLAYAAALVLAFAVAGCSGDDGGAATGGPSETPTSATSSPAESPSSTGPSYFESSVTPARGIVPGTELTSRGSGAIAATEYYCLLAVYDTAGGGVSAPLESSLTPVTSTDGGDVTCTLEHEAFVGKDNEGVERHCPTTAADREDGFSCGVVFVDAATLGAESASAAPFTPQRQAGG